MYPKSCLAGSNIGKTSESTGSYGRAYAREAYTWSNTNIKKKVGLSAGGLIGGEIGILLKVNF